MHHFFVCLSGWGGGGGGKGVTRQVLRWGKCGRDAKTLTLFNPQTSWASASLERLRIRALDGSSGFGTASGVAGQADARETVFFTLGAGVV